MRRTNPGIYVGRLTGHVPSKTRTAEGKSLTRLAARRAAVMTEGEGTRSYAKQLLRFRWICISFLLFFQVSRLLGHVGSDDPGTGPSLGVINVPEARKRRSPCRTLSHTCYKGINVSDRAPDKLSEAQWLPNCPRVPSTPARSCNPSLGAPYLAVNSSNVSSECASLFTTAVWEKARCAFHATGVAR